MKGEWKYKPLMWAILLLARMPMWIIYLHADILFLLLYYVVGYRKKLVIKNLRSSFPEKTEPEVKRIRRQFYRNFADYILETIKLLHISDEQMRRRMTFSNIGVIDDSLRRGVPVVCYFSHMFNWEWAPSITLWSGLKAGTEAEFCQVYRPLQNGWFDALMLRIRGRFGAVSLPKRRAFLDLLRFKKSGIPTVTGFMSDQKPSHGDTIHVVDFLHHPTAIITGTETVARRLDATVVYWHMTKPARGHYHIEVVKLEAPREEFSLTDEYAKLLQANILEQPSLWLWSHNRWKIPVTEQMNNQKVQ